MRLCSLRNLGGAMLLRTVSHLSGVDFISPLIVPIVVLSCLSILFVCALLRQMGKQYSAVKYTRDRALIRNVFASAPLVKPANLNIML